MHDNNLICRNSLELRTLISFGDFSWDLRNYYNGTKEKPEINSLIRDINDKYIPGLFPGSYTLNDVISQYRNPTNIKCIVDCVDMMLERTKNQSTVDINSPFFSSNDVIPLLILDAYDKRDFFSSLKKTYILNVVDDLVIKSRVQNYFASSDIDLVSFNYKKTEPLILSYFEISFNINVPVSDLFSFIEAFKKIGAKYVTPLKYYQPARDVAFKICHKHKRLEEIYDAKRDFRKETTKASLNNIGQSYKSTSLKIFAEAIPIDHFLKIPANASMDEILNNFRLLTYRYAPPQQNYYDREDYYTGFELTEDDYRDMYRDAFDGNPDAEWNID